MDRALETARKIAQSQADFDDDCNPLPVAEIAALIQSAMNAQEREWREALRGLMDLIAAQTSSERCMWMITGPTYAEAERLLAERGEGR